MNIYDQIAARIIREQELLMGPVAWSEASKVQGLKIIDKSSGSVEIEKGSNESAVLDKLVDRFGNLFGRAGREVCKEAVSALVADLPPAQVPVSLK
jgi:hypothetical protein